MFINNSWPNDYCTCNRCPCCGKIVRPRLTSSWGTGGNTHMNCTTTSINDPKNAGIRSAVQNLIDTDQLVLS